MLVNLTQYSLHKYPHYIIHYIINYKIDSLKQILFNTFPTKINHPQNMMYGDEALVHAL